MSAGGGKGVKRVETLPASPDNFITETYRINKSDVSYLTKLELQFASGTTNNDDADLIANNIKTIDISLRSCREKDPTVVDTIPWYEIIPTKNERSTLPTFFEQNIPIPTDLTVYVCITGSKQVLRALALGYTGYNEKQDIPESQTIRSRSKFELTNNSKEEQSYRLKIKDACEPLTVVMYPKTQQHSLGNNDFKPYETSAGITIYYLQNAPKTIDFPSVLGVWAVIIYHNPQLYNGRELSELPTLQVTEVPIFENESMSVYRFPSKVHMPLEKVCPLCQSTKLESYTYYYCNECMVIFNTPDELVSSFYDENGTYYDGTPVFNTLDNLKRAIDNFYFNFTSVKCEHCSTDVSSSSEISDEKN